MANLMDYVQWRGDLPFERDPLNPVDSLMFAVLCYLPFEKVMAQDERVTFAEAFARMEVWVGAPAVDPFVKERWKLGAVAAKCARFGALPVCRVEGETDVPREIQFAACTFLLPDGAAFAAFRGTDESLVGWKEDFNMSFVSPVPAQSEATRYLNALAAALPDAPLYASGHSKGGNLTAYAAAFAQPATQERIRAAWSFDGPGLDDRAVRCPGYARVHSRMRSVVPQSSVVGMLLSYNEHYTVIKSRSVGLLQHDALMWQVIGTGFETADDLNESSRFMDETLHTWLSELTEDDRRLFADTLFDAISATEAATIYDVAGNLPRSALTMIRSFMRLQPQARKHLYAIVGALFSTGAKTAMRGLVTSFLRDNREDALALQKERTETASLPAARTQPLRAGPGAALEARARAEAERGGAERGAAGRGGASAPASAKSD